VSYTNIAGLTGLLRKSSSALAMAVAGGVFFGSAAQAQIDEIIVTAQKREESLQSVPIAVTAFDAAALEKFQIETFGDLRFNVPNVTFTKTNFSGSNFQIRGIGTLLTAASADSGVGQHINDVYINAPLVFETEYYDLAQVEVLRGPQGTLYGRNATGGAVNLKTQRPILGEFGANGEFTYGNFDTKKIKGAVNIPLGEKVAARFAGIWLDRDGYIDNLFTGNDIDGRSQWSVRGSLKFEPVETTSIDIIGHYFKEDSTRARSQKQLCDTDPSPILGCLPTGRGFGSVNGQATAGPLLSSNLVLDGGAVPPTFGLVDVITPIDVSTATAPRDLRTINARFEPDYQTEEIFAMVDLKHKLTDSLDFSLVAGYQEAEIISRQDFNGNVTPQGTLPLALGALPPAFTDALAFFGTAPGGPFFQSDVPIGATNTSLGAVSGDFLLTNNLNARDLSLADSKQWSIEARIDTDLEGPINFRLGGYYLDYEGEFDYFVQSATLEYPALLLANPPFTTTIPPAPPGTFNYLAPGFFNSENDGFDLNSWAVFGEAYFEPTPQWKFTAGLRYTVDEKSVRDRQPFLSVPVNVNATTGAISLFGSPVSDSQDLFEQAAALGIGLFDADPTTPGDQAFREATETFSEFTGRLVADYKPEFSFTDDTLIYASYSRGYKGGGFNPPIDPNVASGVPDTFEPEFVNALELGTKNSLFGNRLQANLTAFYYDYNGLQIGTIVNRTAVNENVDANIYGLESEFVVAPTDNWLFNANLSWLETKIGDSESIDPRDPTGGRDDVTLVKDTITAAHCLIEHNTSGDPTTNPAFLGAAPAGSFIPTSGPFDPYIGVVGPNGIADTPGFNSTAFGSCAGLEAALAGINGGIGTDHTFSNGEPVSLKDNSLINAPEFTVSLGAQYTHFLPADMTLVGRVDYYWQDDFFGRAFNRPQDKVDSWDVINLQLTLNGPDERWFVRGFVQNLTDDDEITGLANADASSGLFTNAFLIEPRLFGVTLGANF